ncbi:MAG: DNA internalization-related competence protein ComEC/Rec2 [Schwartzia sp.]|nr:DNA internalization-related competence protein ComEC/Rec2 [Schwartzia sp. (in: firmicutes)]
MSNEKTRVGQSPLAFLNALLVMFALGVVVAADVCGGYGALTILSLQINMTRLLIFIGAGLFVLSSFLLHRESRMTAFFVALLFFVLGNLRFLVVDYLPASDISFLAGGGNGVSVTGRVVEAPRVTPTSDGARVRYVIDATGAKHEGGNTERVTGRLHVTQYIRWENGSSGKREERRHAEIGDEITATGRLRHIRGYQNPGQMDTVRMARAHGITARLTVQQSNLVLNSKSDDEVTMMERVMRIIGRVREHCRRSMGAAMSDYDAAAIFAMLFGGYDGIKEEMVDSFTVTGIVHILSVSGSHVTLLAGILACLGRALRLRRLLTTLATIIAIISYVALAGFVPPAVRAGIMGALALIGIALGRERDSRHALTLAAIVMLIISPHLIFDVSFILSFLSTAGLLYISPVTAERINDLLPAGKFYERHEGVASAVIGSIAVTVGAQLATLPIVAWYFHVVSLSSLIANILVVPVVELIIVAGVLACIVGIVMPPLSRLIFAIDALALGVVYEATRLIARLPMSQIYMPPMNFFSSLCYYSVVAFALQGRGIREQITSRIKKCRVVIFSCAAAIMIFALVHFAMTPDEMSVHFIDVGQGDSALVVTPHGRAFMIDAGGTRDGSYDVGARVDVPYLLHHGVRSLDCIFLTHAHEDHAAGAGGIIRRVPVGMVLTAGEGAQEYRASMALSADELASTHIAASDEGDVITIDGVTIETIYAPGKGTGSGNEMSNVYRVSYGDVSFLFTGDLVSEHEAAILSSHGNVRSTVLKVAHHGSKTSSTKEFLRAVGAQYAVISVGYENSFGHPNRETIDALREANVERVYRTDENGAIVFVTDGKKLQAKPYVDGQ